MRAADFFRSLGFDATTDAEVRGVRATHLVDVSVTFTRFGIRHFWVVECKLWQTPISKDKVLTLQSLIQDAGADKGFLLSESGFQAGAVRAAESTNILLTSLETLRVDATSELTALAIDDLLRRYEDAMLRLSDMTWREEYRQSDRSGGLIGYSPRGYFEVVGRASVLEQALRSARRNRFPVLLEVDTQERPRLTSDLTELLTYAEAYLQTVYDYLETNKDFGKKPRA
jgi:Restriction endonuclease